MTNAQEFDDGSFSLSIEWKEALTYWEGINGYIFDCAWGVQPRILLVPPPEHWDDVVPSWMVGRRDEIVERLERHSGHLVEHDDRYLDAYWSSRIEDWRLRVR